MGPYGPGGSGMPGGMPGFFHDDSWWGVTGHLLPLLLLALLIGVMIWAVIRLTPGKAPLPSPAAIPATPLRDPAVEELRIRYARGEVDADEYRRRAADLGSPAAPPTSAGAPEPTA